MTEQAVVVKATFTVLQINGTHGECEGCQYLHLQFHLQFITRRMHGIVGERERSNCVVDMRCI